MRYCIIDGILYADGQSTNVFCTEVEETFWARIQELEKALTAIAFGVKLPSSRPSGAVQIDLSKNDMQKIADLALKGKYS